MSAPVLVLKLAQEGRFKIENVTVFPDGFETVGLKE